MLNVSTVNASAKMALNRTDPVVLISTSVELSPISVEIMRAALMLQAHFDVSVYPVMWEHPPEFNAKRLVKMLNVVNMHIVNQMVSMPIVSVKKAGHIIPKILLLVALKSMNVTLLENVLVLQALQVRFFY